MGEGPTAPAFATAPDTPPPGLVRRVLQTQRHLAGVIAGALIASVDADRQRPREQRHPLFGIRRGIAALLRPFIARDLRGLPFPVQLRRRLERLGATYIKLGQILSLREDLLPRDITSEFKNLLDRLPAVPYERVVEIVEATLERPVIAAFASIERTPIGSASIGQVHRATTIGGDAVIVKIVKPGIRETLERDAVLLRISGTVLNWVIPRFRPKQVFAEFVEYTLREVDLRREADNAETFTANFKDRPDIVFPRIYRELSGRDVLTMEFLDGIKPSDVGASLSDAERDTLIDLGATAIIRMLYRDGFFHADLHPGNLMVLPGPKCGFIDLGMVGRFDEELRRTLMYYFYCLVAGDAENAARYLLAVAEPGPGADPHGFRRDVEDVSRRWSRTATFSDFSLARLMLESVTRAAHYRMYFPVELVLMVKAVVTYEGVGQMLKPGFDIASISQAHIRAIFLEQFSPLRFAREGARSAPEVIDALLRAPMLLNEGLRMIERTTRQPAENPLVGVRTSLLAGACLIGGVIALVTKGPLALWVGLFVLAVFFALKRK
ncbi:MAG: AarF/ABC1/UbiB kinase family protein [Acidobacteria bacterium]|jgi:ubiquinone biosynthesis protein|nr:AarF/ABC1/UbiB kinase family protein [Acidobacteriota bacterium]